MTTFPGVLGVIERVAGKDAATKLALRAGGTVMTFSPRPSGALAKIVGPEAAKAIVAELGAEKYTIPMAHLRGQKGRRAVAARLLAQGASSAQTSLACDIHERTARRIRKKSQEKAPLFDRD